jgi:mannose-6-phosphate isomerase-like protein (cupin superfamily)
MTRLIKQTQAKRLDLPGRMSLEAVSGAIGSRMSFRIVEIAPLKPGAPLRGPHLHNDFEECIYVLSGQAAMHAESGVFDADPGDILLIPPGEKHMTINTGSEPLRLLCFFPVPDVGVGTTEFKSF